MPVPPEMFDDDYLYFYADLFGPERSDAEAELVARLLKLEPGMRVLDVPCGEGRIAGRLARMGCEVVGVDYTEAWIALARKQYPEGAFHRGDMRSLEYDQEFDAVVNWFTSFGYFDRLTNDRVLGSFARALRPGGNLLLEVHNPWRLQRLTALAGGSSAYVVDRDGDMMADRATYDGETSTSRTERFIVRDGHLRRLEFTLEQVPGPELANRLERAGFAKVALFGEGGSTFGPDSRRLIALAHKSAVGEPPPERPPVSLREVDDGNVRAVCELKVAPTQESYVASNGMTVAESAYEPHAWLRAIYAGDELVGLLGLVADTETPDYWLARLMIAGQHQGRGYGRDAMALLIEHVRSLPEAHKLETSCVPADDGPLEFYLGLGFEQTGEVREGELVLRLSL
ncbi:MAG TPA: GNAT family N-acetyltransferase [Solirubrobacteraceae bacterium]|nr:GNAT family N-acetyltransferase [Solirubrobacteraceae bacterium]